MPVTFTPGIAAIVGSGGGMSEVPEYLQGVMPLFIGAGGQLVRRLKTDQVIQGRPSGMTLVMDFDSAETITELFESDDYAALVPIPDKGFEEMNILLTHTM